MSTPSTKDAPNRPDLSPVVTQLMKGVVYRDTHEQQWRDLLQLQSAVRDYVGVIGLTVVIDESEGYAYLRSRPELDDADTATGPDSGTPKIPRLIARRSLSFPVSLLLALLRKKLIEFDSTAAGSSRLMLTREQIVEMMRMFLPDGSNEARLVDQIDAQISKVVDLGFLRKIKGQQHTYEVRRILKAFIDGQWLSEFDERLAAYRTQLTGESEDEE